MPTDRYLNVAGGSIFARRWDPTVPARNAPLVLLHDSLGSVELWRDFPACLAEKLRRPVVAYDRLGFGRSSARAELPSAEFIHEEAEQYLPAVLRELAISEFFLFGHSVGGAMALVAAARGNDSCLAVITESAQAFVENCTFTGVERAKESFEEPEQFARLVKWHGPKAQWVLDAWTETWLSAKFASWTLDGELPLVRCPVLVIHGDRDEYGSIHFPEYIRDHVGGPAEMQILAGCGHVPHRERPELVLDLVARFAPLAVC